MKVILSVDALSPILTGIGRYTWALANGIPLQIGDKNIDFYRQNRWIRDPGMLLCEPVPKEAFKRPKRFFGVKPPNWLNAYSQKKACHDKVFHGPNYFVPACADRAVATVHDLSVFKFPYTHPIERIRHFEREFTASLSRVQHLITDSEATRQEVIDFLSWPPDKITAIPLGVGSNFKPKPAAALEIILAKFSLVAGRYGLSVSTLEPRKKIDHLISAYELLPDSLRQIYPLVLVGGAGWLSDALHERIDRLSAQGWLRYLGFVAEDDLPFLYAGARAFFFPSIYEGFGLPVLEAMASGTPVVASNCSSLPEVTKGAALLVNPDDIDAFKIAIEQCLLDDVWREGAIYKGFEVAHTYSWSRCVSETIDVYKKIA